MGINDRYRDKSEQDRAEVSEFLKSRPGQITLIVVFGAIGLYAAWYLLSALFYAIF